jgi:hypothetical protein
MGNFRNHAGSAAGPAAHPAARRDTPAATAPADMNAAQALADLRDSSECPHSIAMRPRKPADDRMLFAMAEHLELPRPWRLLLTAGWNLAESVGLPVAAYAVAAQLDGRDTGMVAAAAMVWLTVVARKVITKSVPGLLMISALVLTLQAAVVLATGNLWFFLLQFPLANLCMCVLFARTASTHKPLVAQLAAEVIALRQPSTHHPGLHRFFQGATWLWAGIFLVLTIGMSAMMMTEPVKLFLMLTTAVTVGLCIVGTALSTVWFFAVLRRLGLGLRFA